MSEVFAGSDGSFISAWQVWKRRNHEPESFVLAHGDTLVFRTTSDGSNGYVWYVGVEEEDLPDDVALDGVTVRDSRSM